ncbi:hypothetical protein D3C80_440230 [compost metagenome]
MNIIHGCFGEALVRGDVGAIGHQANCFNTMKSGAAATVRKLFPEAIEADLQTVLGSKLKLGTFSVGETSYGPVFNLYGQYNFGYDGRQYTDYHALGLALHQMQQECRNRCIDTVGFVKLGCGLAGGEWGVVGPMIERAFPDTIFTVNIYVK